MFTRFTRKQRRRERSARLFDAHGSGLLAVANTLTSTRSRADRLVVDTIAQHTVRRSMWSRQKDDDLLDMSKRLHAQWVSTHAPRGPRYEDDSSIRGRMHDLSDIQLGLVALCLFGGFTNTRAANLLSLTPDEVAGELRRALVVVGA